MPSGPIGCVLTQGHLSDDWLFRWHLSYFVSNEFHLILASIALFFTVQLFSYFRIVYPTDLEMRPNANEWMSPYMPIPGEETRRRITHGADLVREFDDGADD